MRDTTRNLKRRIALGGLVLLCVGLTGSSCMKDRLVDVVVGGELIVPFLVQGSDSTWDESQIVDLGSETDLDRILSDNGIERGTVRAKLESISYRVTRKDPTTDRTISGSIVVGDSLLVEFTGIVVDDPINENWVSVPLTRGGTDVIDSALEAYLADRIPAILTFRTMGTSTPANIATDFEWEVRVKVGIVGKKKIRVFEPF